ncbi:unnamed protein product [Parnassius apollo]|uniref:(apollo) hypothetical protein n=1 Tax=Parnassius apollo TaxID=110799 RepID=A0A8S3W4W9_PARAO|nr:unnamed protein product [Parnassius apollo]
MNCEKLSTVLHWNYRGFTEFPIRYLQGEEAEVTDIYLKENLISHVPNDIGKLRNLESLYLSGNDITELPREISNLRCLKCLDVSGNRLRCIPDEIGEMRALKFLILDENELRSLPLRIAELRLLRYLSVCDNQLQWLPQRPVYNYFHCEFRFWRNVDLKSIPYSLWYHMFRGQQTRSLNIGCLNITGNVQTTRNTCKFRLKIHQESKEFEIDINCPPQYNNIIENGVQLPPSLYELSRRIVYETLSMAARQITTRLSLYSDRSNYYEENCSYQNNFMVDLENNFNGFGVNRLGETKLCDLNGNKMNLIPKRIPKCSGNCKNERRDYYVASDIINNYYSYLPHFHKSDLCNGPISKCENVYCKKPIFDYVYYEFCLEKIILIDSIEEVILSLTFCSKTCADFWKLGKKNILAWSLIK